MLPGLRHTHFQPRSRRYPLAAVPTHTQSEEECGNQMEPRLEQSGVTGDEHGRAIAISHRVLRHLQESAADDFRRDESASLYRSRFRGHRLQRMQVGDRDAAFRQASN